MSEKGTAALEPLLDAYKEGRLNSTEAVEAIRSCFFSDLGHSRLDMDRERRTGAPEVVYGAGKTTDQIEEIVRSLAESGANVLVTRTDEAARDRLAVDFPDMEWDSIARTLMLNRKPVNEGKGTVGIVCAGTSDLYAAREAEVTARFLGSRTLLIPDVGVAGIHRLLDRIEEIRNFRVIVAVAGMEGALPGVLAGLVDKPVIALPTSVGYGAGFQGVAALLTMLNSCANGISVVNIDAGFNAGYMAAMINRLP